MPLELIILKQNLITPNRIVTVGYVETEMKKSHTNSMQQPSTKEVQGWEWWSIGNYARN